MCIERLWPYWLLHWRTQYYGILTIIALYIVYLITFGCYLKAKWFIVYSWKRYSNEMFSKCFYGKPKKLMEWRWKLEEKCMCSCMTGWSCQSVSEEIRFYIGKNVLKINRCSDVPMSAVGLEWSTLHSHFSRLVCMQCFMYIVNSRTHFYEFFLSLHHYALAYLLFTVSLIFCTSPILVLSCSSIFAQLLYFFHTK